MPDLHFSGGKPANPETAAACADRAPRVAPVRINGDISDLFFNTDHNSAQYDERTKQFIGYDEEKLRSVAADTLGSLERLGVDVPSVDDLIADFYRRL